MKPYMKGLLRKKQEIEDKILNYRIKCKHESVKRKHSASTGNYDPSNDRYWTEIECLDCGCYWTEEGHV